MGRTACSAPRTPVSWGAGTRHYLANLDTWLSKPFMDMWFYQYMPGRRARA